MDDVMSLIHRRLKVDLTNSDTRYRAWQRIRVFRQVADECESDGSVEMAETLRRICRKATEVETGEAERLVYLAMIAGPDST